MQWNSCEQDQDIFLYVKKLANFRRNSKSLNSGNFRFIFTDDEKGTVAYERSFEGADGTEKVVVCVSLDGGIHKRELSEAIGNGTPVVCTPESTNPRQMQEYHGSIWN